MVYPLETVIAEKLETILSRSTLNCRMRDFYDIHILYEMYSQEINSLPLSKALTATAEKRESIGLLQDTEDILMAVEDSPRTVPIYRPYGWSIRKRTHLPSPIPGSASFAQFGSSVKGRVCVLAGLLKAKKLNKRRQPVRLPFLSGVTGLLVGPA